MDDMETSNETTQDNDYGQGQDVGMPTDSGSGYTSPADNERTDSTEEEGIIPAKDWQEDKRYEKFWQKDPNKLYDSYKTLEQKLEDNGLKIRDYEENIDNLKKTSSENESVIKYLESMNSHPEFSKKLGELLNDYTKTSRREAYGADLPDHIVDKLQQIDELKESIEKQKEEQEVEKHKKVIEEQQQIIGDLAKKYNIDYDKHEFLEWCLQNKVNPSSMKAHFLEHAFSYIIDGIKYKTQNNVIKNLDQNKFAGLPSEKTKASSSASDSRSFREKLSEVFNV